VRLETLAPSLAGALLLVLACAGATALGQPHRVVEESLIILRRQLDLLNARIDVLEDTVAVAHPQDPGEPPRPLAPVDPTASSEAPEPVEATRAGITQAQAIVEWLQPVAADAEQEKIDHGRERLRAALGAVTAALDSSEAPTAARMKTLLDDVDGAASAFRRALGHTDQRLRTIEEDRNLAGFAVLSATLDDLRHQWGASTRTVTPPPLAPTLSRPLAPALSAPGSVPPVSVPDTRRQEATEDIRAALPAIRDAAYQLQVHFRGVRNFQGTQLAIDLRKGVDDVETALHRMAVASDPAAATTALGVLNEVVESLDRQRGELERCCGYGGYNPRRPRARQ
jgi:hypothetical protein